MMKVRPPCRDSRRPTVVMNRKSLVVALRSASEAAESLERFLTEQERQNESNQNDDNDSLDSELKHLHDEEASIQRELSMVDQAWAFDSSRRRNGSLTVAANATTRKKNVEDDDDGCVDDDDSMECELEHLREEEALIERELALVDQARAEHSPLRESNVSNFSGSTIPTMMKSVESDYEKEDESVRDQPLGDNKPPVAMEGLGSGFEMTSKEHSTLPMMDQKLRRSFLQQTTALLFSSAPSSSRNFLIDDTKDTPRTKRILLFPVTFVWWGLVLMATILFDTLPNIVESSVFLVAEPISRERTTLSM